MNRLTGKTAIITGAASGIGKAIAQVFAGEGAGVFLCDVNAAALAQSAEEVRRDSAAPQAVWYAACDITSVREVEAAVSSALRHAGAIDILINNAGANFFNEPLHTDEAQWNACLQNDLTGAWNCAKAVLPHMIKNGGGAIVNISSVHGHKIIPGCFPYPVAKHALLGLTKALGVEYAKHNVRINSISPGLIETSGTRAWYERSVAEGRAPSVEAFKKIQADILPCKRIGAPEEVAMVAVMLSSDEARFINAADILIDGGRSALYHE